MKKDSEHKTFEHKDSTLKEIFINGQDYKDILSKKEPWKKIAELYNGNFEIKTTINKDINWFILKIPYRNHILVLTESDTKPLKFETELKLNRNFEFNISWEDTIERVLKLFGRQDIELHDKVFDKKFLIQSNDPVLIVKFLEFRQIKQMFLQHNIYLMDLKYSQKDELHKLMTVKDRNTKKFQTLRELVEFQFIIIDFFIDKNILRS